MKENKHDEEVTKALQDFFVKRFPLKEQKFKTKNELLNYYCEKELELNEELNNLFDKLKPIPYNKKKISENTLLENLIISFELNGYSADILYAIQTKYKELTKKILEDIKKVDKIEGFITLYVKEKINSYINEFNSSLALKFKREEFPNFLIYKFIQLIKNKYLNLISEKNVDVTSFYLSEQFISLIHLYQDIFINKKKFLFNRKNNKECASEYFELILLSNNLNFKKTEMKYLDHFYMDFKYFADIFNLYSLYENKEYDENYILNILIEKFKSEFIDISPEDAESKKSEILKKIIPNNLNNEEMLLNLVLSYTLVLNSLVSINKTTGNIELCINDNYISFASMKVLLDNTLNNFEFKLDANEIKDFSQSILLKDLFNSKNYIENKSYSIDKIKEILTSKPKNKKMKKLSGEFFKGLYTQKYNKVLEFILSINQNYKDKNIRRINLTPLNPKVISTHCYIFISGFLSEKSDHYKEWENLALNLTSSNTCYFYNWPGDCLSNVAGETALNLGLTVLCGFSKNFINNNNNGQNKFEVFDPGKSFIDSSNKAILSGKILAFILASRLFFKFQTITLVGFSLGAHIIKHCIRQMYQLHYKENICCNDIIKDVILIAGATSMKGKEAKFKNIFSKMINGKLINCYSKEDQVLNILYKGCMNKKPIGNNTLELDGYKDLKNIDFTVFHLGHTDYRRKMDLVMNRINLEI